MDNGRRGKDLRIGDTERERAIALLGEHLTAGRLDIHEYDDRCKSVAAARVSSDITVVFDDLPASRPTDDRTTPAPAPSRSGPSAGILVTGLCIAAVLMLFAGAAKQIWLIALLVLGLTLWIRHRRR